MDQIPFDFSINLKSWKILWLLMLIEKKRKENKNILESFHFQLEKTAANKSIHHHPLFETTFSFSVLYEEYLDIIGLLTDNEYETFNDEILSLEEQFSNIMKNV